MPQTCFVETNLKYFVMGLYAIAGFEWYLIEQLGPECHTPHTARICDVGNCHTWLCTKDLIVLSGGCGMHASSRNLQESQLVWNPTTMNVKLESLHSPCKLSTLPRQLRAHALLHHS
eukprot:1686851-Amphidinium_carterae.1